MRVKPKKKRPPKVDKTSVEETNVRGHVSAHYATLTYDLTDEDARERYKVALKAEALQSVIWNFSNYLRQEVKYNSDQHTKTELAIFQKVREALWEEIKLQECEGVLP